MCVAAGASPAAKATLWVGMRGNPNGSLSSAGRFATGLLSLRYTVRTFLSSHSKQRLGDAFAMRDAAGASPAAKATMAK